MQELKTEPLTLGQCMAIMRISPLVIAIVVGVAAVVVYAEGASWWVYAVAVLAALIAYVPSMVDACLYHRSGRSAGATLRLVDGGLLTEWGEGRVQHFCPLKRVTRCISVRGMLLVQSTTGALLFNVRNNPQAAAFVEALEQERLKAGDPGPMAIPPHPEGAEVHREQFDETYVREVSRLVDLQTRPCASWVWLYPVGLVLSLMLWLGAAMWMNSWGIFLLFFCLVSLFCRPGRTLEPIFRKLTEEPERQWSRSMLGETLCISGSRGWWRVTFGKESVSVVRGQHLQVVNPAIGPAAMCLPAHLALPAPIGSLRISHPRADLVLRWVAGVALLLSFVWARVFPSQEDEVVRMSQDKVYELAERFQPREYLQYASLTVSAGSPERHLSFGTFYGSWSVTLDEKLRVKKVLQWSCGEEDMQPYAWPEAELPPCLNEKK